MTEESDGYVTQKKLPKELLTTALLACAAGFFGFVYAAIPMEFCLVLMLGGVGVIGGYDFWANGAINQLNYFRVVVKYLGLLLVSGSVVLFAWYAVGLAAHLEVGAAYLLGGFASAGLGAAAYYYGSRFHQNLNAVELGRKLGFEPADSGVFSLDRFYDSKGVYNGLQVLFNIETVSYRSRKYGPLEYDHTLEIFCYCGARPDLKFAARQAGGGLLFKRPKALFRLSGLTRMPAPEGWDRGCVYRSNDPAAAARALAAAAASADQLSTYCGLQEMWLDDAIFRLSVFRWSEQNPYWDERSLGRLLDAATRLASAFGG